MLYNIYSNPEITNSLIFEYEKIMWFSYDFFFCCCESFRTTE
jgi:hypothetical protein